MDKLKISVLIITSTIIYKAVDDLIYSTNGSAIWAAWTCLYQQA